MSKQIVPGKSDYKSTEDRIRKPHIAGLTGQSGKLSSGASIEKPHIPGSWPKW